MDHRRSWVNIMWVDSDSERTLLAHIKLAWIGFILIKYKLRKTYTNMFGVVIRVSKQMTRWNMFARIILLIDYHSYHWLAYDIVKHILKA